MEGWKRAARWLAPLGWYMVIWCLSAQNGVESQAVSDGVLTELFGIDLAGLDGNVMRLFSFLVRKGAHMGAYFVLTGLILWAWKPWLAGKTYRPWAALGLCAALAALDEVHQLFVPGRSGKLRDVAIDLLGGGLFLLAWWVVRKLRRKKTRAER